MNRPFEPGDIALLVRTTFGENVGKQVELLRCTSDREINMMPHEVGHTINPLGVKCWVVRCPSKLVIANMLGLKFECEYAACPESWLMPLKGEDETETLNIEEEVAA